MPLHQKMKNLQKKDIRKNLNQGIMDQDVDLIKQSLFFGAKINNNL